MKYCFLLLAFFCTMASSYGQLRYSRILQDTALGQSMFEQVYKLDAHYIIDGRFIPRGIREYNRIFAKVDENGNIIKLSPKSDSLSSSSVAFNYHMIKMNNNELGLDITYWPTGHSAKTVLIKINKELDITDTVFFRDDLDDTVQLYNYGFDQLPDNRYIAIKSQSKEVIIDGKILEKQFPAVRWFDTTGLMIRSQDQYNPLDALIGTAIGLISVNNHIYVAGKYQDGTKFDRNAPHLNILQGYYIRKLTLDGVPIDSFISPVSEFAHLIDFTVLASGSLFLHINELIPTQIGNNGVVNWETREAFAYLDKNFKRQWYITKGNGLPAAYDGIFYFDIKESSNRDGLVAVGYNPQFDSTKLSIDSTTTYGYIIKFDYAGNKLWDRKLIHAPLKPLKYFVLQKITPTEDNGYFAVGHYVANNWVYSADYFETGGWYVKLDEFGCLVPGCQTVPTKEEESQTIDVTSYPNPCGNLLKIRVYQWQIDEAQMEIYDMMGIMRKSIKLQALADAQYTIDVSDLTPGQYVYHVRSKDQKRAVGKFIKI